MKQFLYIKKNVFEFVMLMFQTKKEFHIGDTFTNIFSL